MQPFVFLFPHVLSACACRSVVTVTSYSHSLSVRAATHPYAKTSKRSPKANKHFRKQFTGKSKMSSPNDELVLLASEAGREEASSMYAFPNARGTSGLDQEALPRASSLKLDAQGSFLEHAQSIQLTWAWSRPSRQRHRSRCRSGQTRGES